MIKTKLLFAAFVSLLPLLSHAQGNDKVIFYRDGQEVFRRSANEVIEEREYNSSASVDNNNDLQDLFTTEDSTIDTNTKGNTETKSTINGFIDESFDELKDLTLSGSTHGTATTDVDTEVPEESTTEQSNGFPLWIWIVGGLIIAIVAIGTFFGLASEKNILTVMMLLNQKYCQKKVRKALMLSYKK